MFNFENLNNYDISNVYNDCLTIINDKKSLTSTQMANKWENFKKVYPQLYSMLLITENVDLNMLKFMCDKAQTQLQLPKEQQLENDFNIGDKLAQKYIYDKFPEPSQQQKEFIKETLRQKINNGETFSTSAGSSNNQIDDVTENTSKKMKTEN